jgi:hypothetical protein
VPATTNDLLLAYMRSPEVLERMIKPWGLSLPQELRRGGTIAREGKREGQGDDMSHWDFGFRSASHECGDCDSWACTACTEQQRKYALRCGDQHKRQMGQEWRET